MNLTYSDEQLMLRDTVRRFLAANYDFAARRSREAATPCLDRKIWSAFADLGLLGLPFSVEDGGSGGGPVEISIAMEEFGRALMVEPWLGVVVLAGGIVQRLASPEQRAELLGSVASGRQIHAFAHFEREAGDDLGLVRCRAGRVADEFVLNGAKTLVLGGADASLLLVSAQLEDGGDRQPVILLVPSSASGVKVTAHRLVDMTSAADVIFDDVRLPATAVLASGDAVAPAIAATIDAAIAAIASDAVGAMDALLEATTAYTRQRVQFDKPLSSFQALQHRMAEMAVKCQEARASALLATLSVDGTDHQRARGVSGAKFKVASASRHVAQEAIQLHGAIGFTEELVVGSWFRRLYAFENLFSPPAYHLRRYLSMIRSPEVAARGLI